MAHGFNPTYTLTVHRPLSNAPLPHMLLKLAATSAYALVGFVVPTTDTKK